MFPQVRLEWPTDLAVSPLDNALYVLDNNLVLQVSESQQVRVVAGRPIHCPMASIEPVLLGKAAVRSVLEGAKAIAVSHQGTLYIAETDDRKHSRVQEVSTNGEMVVIAGATSECDCKIDPSCECFSGESLVHFHINIFFIIFMFSLFPSVSKKGSLLVFFANLMTCIMFSYTKI